MQLGLLLSCTDFMRETLLGGLGLVSKSLTLPVSLRGVLNEFEYIFYNLKYVSRTTMIVTILPRNGVTHFNNFFHVYIY